MEVYIYFILWFYNSNKLHHKLIQMVIFNQYVFMCFELFSLVFICLLYICFLVVKYKFLFLFFNCNLDLDACLCLIEMQWTVFKNFGKFRVAYKLLVDTVILQAYPILSWICLTSHNFIVLSISTKHRVHLLTSWQLKKVNHVLIIFILFQFTFFQYNAKRFHRISYQTTFCPFVYVKY